ncbi:MAG: hypothetical protein IT463_13935 [Planctomycetes bacterium]|nr:hypothetical protein [Planctomycetota bacterium]
MTSLLSPGESERTYSPELSDADFILSAIERLKHRNRTINPNFDAEEWLFAAFKRFGEQGGGRIGVYMDDLTYQGTSYPYPGSDGMSLNRAKFSLASDVLVSTASDVLRCVAGIQAQDLPKDFRPLSDPTGSVWSLKPKHKPTAMTKRKKDGVELPENFAHSILMHHVDDREKPGSKVKNKEVLRTFKTALAHAFIPIVQKAAT